MKTHRFINPNAFFRINLLLTFKLLTFFINPLSAQTPIAPSTGSGTAANPYEIATLDNLVWIQDNTANWDKHYIQTDNIDASPSASWNSNTGWMPIGNETTPFTGKYNGNGFEISDLSINRSGTDFQGLFGVADNADLRNISIIDGSVVGGSNVGAIAGRALNTYINNCVLTATSVSGSSTLIGGWVGDHSYSDSIQINNIILSATISGFSVLGGFFGATSAPVFFYNITRTGNTNNNSTNNNSGFNVGGLVGHATYNQAAYTPEYVNCSNTGVVSTSRGGNVGGIVGNLSKGHLINCSNNQNVNSRSNVGGIVGTISNGKLINCTHSANVTASGANTTSNNAGGIAGQALNTEIRGCVFSGTSVSAQGGNAGGWVGNHSYNDTLSYSNLTLSHNVQGRSNVGGLFGTTSAPISFYNITRTGNTNAGGSTSSNNAGSIVGNATYNQAAYTPEYVNCSNTGSVSASGSNVGGIVGNLSKGHLINCNNNQNVIGRSNVGGIVGTISNGKLINCTHSANVTASGANTTSNNAGGIAGQALNTEIRGCVFSGTSVSAQGGNAGGWVGNHSYNDTLSYSNLTLSHNVQGRFNVGGLFGTTSAPISFYDITRTGNTASSANCSVCGNNVGSLVGNATYNQATYTPEYVNCSNTGVISRIGGGSGVGGIVGRISKGNFINCINNTNFNVNGDVIGGIVGFLTNGEIKYCSNCANISGRNLIGGIVGEANSSLIYRCFNTGSITSSGDFAGGLSGRIITSTALEESYNLGAVRANQWAGGLVGDVSTTSILKNCYHQGNVWANTQYSGGITGRLTQNGSIFHCYSVPTFSGSTTDRNGTVGQLISGSTTHTFWDSQVSGVTSSPAGTGLDLTTTQMQQQATFTNWDFQFETANGTDDIWGIDEGNDYPRLSWEPSARRCPVKWFGTLSDDWNTAGNWSASLIPITGDFVIIDASAQNDLVLDQNRVVGDIAFKGANKKIILGNHNLTATDIIDADVNNYIQTNGSGVLKSNIPANTSFTFPIGNSAYNPLTVTNKNAADDFSVRVIDDVFLNGFTGPSIVTPHVKVTWDINKTNPGNTAGVDFEFQWDASQEFGSPASFELNHHNGSNWEFAAGTSGTVTGTPKTMTHTGYTGTFSPFAIGGSDLTPLPVSYVSFDAIAFQQNPRLCKLTWSTSTEINNSHFEVEWSASNTGKWEKVGVVASQEGNSFEEQHYDFMHATPSQLNMYRLKQVDWDGNYSYSPLRTVWFEYTDPIRLYPNPTQDIFTLEISGVLEGQYSLFDAKGRLIESGICRGEKSFSGLAAGVYQLRVQIGDKVDINRVIVSN